MRPVDKGSSPYTSIDDYKKATDPLVDRIGHYCSYCEMNIMHIPHVEHVESKNSGGDETAWDNLMLSCTYCNSRKGEHIKVNDRSKWLWPDTDNTFRAFSYAGGIPALSINVSQDTSAYQKAKDMFDCLKLDNHPNPRDRDRRWVARLEAFNTALKYKTDWDEGLCSSTQSIARAASATGFFSTWMMVFEGDVEIRQALIKAFKGTAQNCFDGQTMPIHRQNGSF